MKKIKYTLRGNSVETIWSENAEAIARKEADNEMYEIFDDGTLVPADNLTERVTAVESDVAALTTAIEKGLAL